MSKERLYFLLSLVVLTITCLLIVAAVFSFAYVIYRLSIGGFAPSKEPHFQFDDTQPDGRASRLEGGGAMPLEKIVEEDEEKREKGKEEVDGSESKSTVG